MIKRSGIVAVILTMAAGCYNPDEERSYGVDLVVYLPADAAFSATIDATGYDGSYELTPQNNKIFHSLVCHKSRSCHSSGISSDDNRVVLTIADLDGECRGRFSWVRCIDVDRRIDCTSGTCLLADGSGTVDDVGCPTDSVDSLLPSKNLMDFSPNDCVETKF